MKLVTAVRRGLRSLDLAEQDTGTVELALAYAREIDGATLVRATLVKVLREVEALDVDLYDRLLAELVRVERVHVVGLLGPRLLAALESLLMSPRARAAVARGVSARDDIDRSPLEQLRARRAARAHETPIVDPAAP